MSRVARTRTPQLVVPVQEGRPTRVWPDSFLAGSTAGFCGGGGGFLPLPAASVRLGSRSLTQPSALAGGRPSLEVGPGPRGSHTCSCPPPGDAERRLPGPLGLQTSVGSAQQAGIRRAGRHCPEMPVGVWEGPEAQGPAEARLSGRGGKKASR